MIGKHFSKSHLVRHDATVIFLENYGWLVVALLVFTVLIPVSTAGFSGNSIFNVEFTHQQLKFRFFSEDFATAINACAIFYGGGLGLALYRFQLDKKQATVFFSLGLGRVRLFWSRYLIGFLMLVGGLILPLVAALVLNLVALGPSPGLFSHCFYLGGGLLLLAMLAFTISLISCCLAGTLFEAAAVAIALLAAPTVISYSVNIFLKVLLWGNAFGAMTYSGTVKAAPDLLTLWSPFNPLLFFQKPLQEQSLFYRSLTQAQPQSLSFGLLLAWAGVVALLIFLALLALKRRKVEQAGLSGLIAWLQLLPIFLICLTASALIFNFAATFKLALGYWAVAVFSVVCYGLLRFTVFRNRGAWRVNAIGLGLQSLIIAILIIVPATGGLGYSQRLPLVSQVAAVSCSYVGSPNYLNSEIKGSSSGKGYYVMSSYSYDEPEDVAKVLALHRSFCQQPQQELQVDTGDFAKTVLPYDISIAYTLQNGKRLVRYYDRASLEQLTALLALDDSKQVKKSTEQAILGMDKMGVAVSEVGQIGASVAFRYGDIYLSDSQYDSPYALVLGDQQRQQLLQAIAADQKNYTWQQRYFPTEPCLGVLMFSMDGENDSHSFAYNLENSLVYLTKNDVHSLAFLRANDLLPCLDFKGQIESIAFQKYNPYGGINRRKLPVSSYFMAYRSGSAESYLIEEDFGRKRPIVEQNKIAELLPLLKNTYFMNDGGYLACIKLAGKEVYTYKYLPADLAPDYVTGK